MKRQEIYKEVEEIDNKIMKPSIILMIRAHICSEFSNKTILFFVVQSTEFSIKITEVLCCLVLFQVL